MPLVSLLVLAVAAQATAPKGVLVKEETYNGWPNAYRVSNGVVDLVAVGAIGRIMRFGWKEGPNLLWENPEVRGKAVDRSGKEWNNYGGDKLWVAPQSLWEWPPPVELDAGPYQAIPIENGLRLVGPINPRFGVRMTREILIDPKKPIVSIKNRMENATGIHFTRSIWQIAQIDAPDEAVLGLSKRWPQGFHGYGVDELWEGFHVRDGDLLRLKRHPEKSRKFGGAASHGRILIRKGDTEFRMSTRYQGRAEYPDEGSAQQIFLNPDPMPYVELELAGPLTRLKPGAATEMTVRWELLKTGG